MATTDRGRPPANRKDVSARATSQNSMHLLPSTTSWRSARTISITILLAYFSITLFASVIVHSAGIVARGNETTGDRAIFTAFNAATLSGFQQTMGVREMNAVGPEGPFLLFFLTIFGSLTSLIVGGLAACRILRMPHTTSQIIWAACTTLLLATLAGAAALAGTGRTVFEAIFQAGCAFSNSGLWLGAPPTPTDVTTHLVLLPLAVLGGFGLPVIIELTDQLFGGPRLSRYSRIVLVMAAAFYLGGTLVLTLAQWPAASGGGWPAWRNTLASCSIAAINTRTAGIPIQSPAAFTAAGQWVLMLLMTIGVASAGTAGGLKMTTFWQLARGIRGALNGRPAERTTGIAAVWLVAYSLALFVGILLLVSSEPQMSRDRLLFLATSAIGNVGLSHDPVSITGPGLLVLSGLMIFGRIAPLAILWWMAETTNGADIVVG
jgi:Trk-type K+ transport system membrane component